MSTTGETTPKASALVTAHTLHRLLVQLCKGPEQDVADNLECARDYMEDVIALLEERSTFPTRPPSPNLDGRLGGSTEILICERALAQIHRTKQFIENHFADEDHEPPGWCPIEACYYLDEAIAMLEPNECAEEPLPPRLRIVGGTEATLRGAR